MGRPALKARPKGWTLGDLMRLPLAIALVFWLVRADPARHRYDMGLLLSLMVGSIAWMLARILFASRCPACGRGPNARVAMVPFGLHYLRCSACGQRMKRSLWMGTIWDASGPEDDTFFEPKVRPVVTWGDDPRIAPNLGPQTRTVGNLLRGKLDREAAAPDAVDLDGGEAGRASDCGDEPRRAAGRPTLIRPLGVKSSVAKALFRTWGAIRWERNSRRSS